MEFNRIYRNLEGALTDAAQFAALCWIRPRFKCRLAQSAGDARPQRRGEWTSAFQAFACAAAAVRSVFLAVAAGTKLGSSGRSGGGKTTITRAPARFKDSSAARSSSAASRSPMSLNRHSGRSSVCASGSRDVPRTIADNIRFARPEATTRSPPCRGPAHAAEFVQALTDGYDTLVG